MKQLLKKALYYVKEGAKFALVSVIGFALLQFVIVGPSTAQGYTGCRCDCHQQYPTGSCFANGNPTSCKDICAGKVTIVEWSGNLLASAWEWYQLTGY